MDNDSSARSVTFDTMGTLENFIGDYQLSEADEPSIIIIEAIANSIDANAKNINLQLMEDKITGKYFFKITDNGEGMPKKAFEENYHKFSYSSKTKGEGIGFAGIGAKLVFKFSKDIRISTLSIGPDGPLSSTMWWNKADKEIKWNYTSPDQSDLSKLRQFRSGTIYKVEIGYSIYNYLWNNYNRIVNKWYYAVLLGYYDIALTFNSKAIEPEKFETEKTLEKNIKVEGKTCKCIFYLLKKDLPEDKGDVIGINFYVYGKFIKTDHPNWGGRIKPEFEQRVCALVLADPLAVNLNNVNKMGFKQGSKLYASVKKEVEIQFSKWLKEIGALRDEGEVLPVSKEISLLAQVLQSKLQMEKFRDFNPFIKRINQKVLVESKTGELQGTKADGSQLTGGTFGGDGVGGGTKVGGDQDGKGLVKDKGDIPMEERERKVRTFSISSVAVNEPWEAKVDVTTQFLQINIAHPYYIAAQKANTSIKWLQTVKAVVDALAYYKADEIFNNDYRKGSELIQELYMEVWKGLTE